MPAVIGAAADKRLYQYASHQITNSRFMEAVMGAQSFNVACRDTIRYDTIVERAQRSA